RRQVQAAVPAVVFAVKVFPMAWIVHKFGGTSVADARCFERVAGIVARGGHGPLAVVVSAMKGMTDQLLGLIDRAVACEPVEDTLRELTTRYETAVRDLLDEPAAEEVLAAFRKDLADIEAVLKALSLVRAASPRSRALVSGFGEVWSARLLTATLKGRPDVSRPA